MTSDHIAAGDTVTVQLDVPKRVRQLGTLISSFEIVDQDGVVVANAHLQTRVTVEWFVRFEGRRAPDLFIQGDHAKVLEVVTAVLAFQDLNDDLHMAVDKVMDGDVYIEGRAQRPWDGYLRGAAPPRSEGVDS